MEIHEYQAKKLLSTFGVTVPKGVVAFTADEAKKAATTLNTSRYVVKAQIHAGGRGKAGGVKLVSSTDEVYETASKMLGMTLVTHQTGPQGKVVKRIYVEEASNIDKELYLGLVVDREKGTIGIIASADGGVEIEEIAEHHPERILKVFIDPATGIQGYHARKLAFGMGLKGDLIRKFQDMLFSLYEAFVKTDASQIEINPLVITKEATFVALDAKVNFDDNAIYRHQDFLELRDENEEEPLEIRATNAGLSYVKMDGNIGCMVNGAGLAMATMDIIKLYGAEPANFLDVGGGANKERVTEAFKIILSDKNVQGILVNIFGGIMRCDIIAEGIIAAAKDVGVAVPLVVRLAGTNFELGKKMLDNSGLSIISADDLADAADKIVKAIKKKAA